MTPFEHMEAFCLMWYQCEECTYRELLWNSRDGVTPFCIPCSKCGKVSQHTTFSLDLRTTRDYGQVLPDDFRVFVDITRDRAVEFATRRLLGWVDHKEFPAPQKDSVEWNEVIRSLADDIFKDGTAPDIVSAKEWKDRK